jgi:glycosyltransferase involved in cell wall biosynthesis
VFDDAAAILCVDYEETGKMAERYPDKRVIHLPNGVDPARFAAGDRARFRDRIGIGQDMPLLLNVSRIDHQKNQWLAVDILARLLEGGQNMHLALIGPITNPAYHERLAKAIADQNLSDYVTIIPGLPPGDPLLADAYKSADAFLLTSLHEPFGIVILEAWAAGCPVVCTSVGGIPHFTEDGEDTLRFASGDAGAATSHLRQLLSTPSLAARLVENGRRKALGTYSWDRITEQLANLYQEVRGERTSR